MGISFRHSAGFGKRMEYNLVGKMLMEGLDVYIGASIKDAGKKCFGISLLEDSGLVTDLLNRLKTV